MTNQSQNEYTKQGHIVRNVYEREVWNLAIEAAAKIVDQCNREGPYEAIFAARRIRELKK